MMNKSTVFLVLALGCAVSLSGLTGCAGTKKIVEQPVKVETKAPAPAPPPPAPAPKPAPPAPPKKVEEASQPPRDLAFASVYFDFDKSDIRTDQVGSLNSNAELLNRWKTTSVRIEGNCDERGSNEYNLALGQRRADSAKRFMTDYGILESRITTISYGEERPVDTGHNEEAWAKNRRDDFIISGR
jgi:peptidoglycan-associated lipoprotein